MKRQTQQLDFGTIYYPTADNPPRQTQNNRIATTKFVYDVATADNGGRVYVSSVAGIGDDANDGRSAAKPVRTIKKAAQIAIVYSKIHRLLNMFLSFVQVVTM